MPARTRLIIASLAFLCFLLLFPAGCANNAGCVDTLLTLDSSCSGERSMKLTLPGVDLDGEAGLSLDALLNEACPKELSYSKEADGYRFILRFQSHEDYVAKLSSLLGRAPEVVFAVPDTILASGWRLREDFDSSELFGWLLQEIQNRGLSSQMPSSFSCGSTAVRVGEYSQAAASRIDLNAVSGYSVDSIEISTTRRTDGDYDRTVVFAFPRATTDALGEDLISYLNARTARGAYASWEDFPSGRKYTVRMDRFSLEKLEQATSLLFNSQLTGGISYGANQAEALPFTANNSFEERLDLSGYSAGGNVLLTYRYTVEEGEQRVSVQTMERGVWKQIGSSSIAACEITQNASYLRLRIPEETSFPLQKTNITLSCLGRGSFERTVEFLFADGDAQGAQYAADYFSARASGAEVSAVAGESGPVCRLVMSGTAEELSAQATALFGDGNLMDYHSEGGAAEIHRRTSMTDALHMEHLFAGGHEDTPISYTIQTNGKERLDHLEYKSKTSSNKVRLDQGPEGTVTFDLDNGDTEIIYNGNTPNWFGVSLVLIGTAAIIVLAVVFVFYIRKRGGGKTPPKNPPEEDDPNESIEDILADL